MPENPPKTEANGIISFPKETKPAQKTCHRFFAPVVIPEPDPLNPRSIQIKPRMGNFPCIKEQCMLWNAEKEECWDVTGQRGLALVGDYAYGKANDVFNPSGGQ